MSDVHCPVCIFSPCNKTIVTDYDVMDSVITDNNNYTLLFKKNAVYFVI